MSVDAVVTLSPSPSVSVTVTPTVPAANDRRSFGLLVTLCWQGKVFRHINLACEGINRDRKCHLTGQTWIDGVDAYRSDNEPVCVERKRDRRAVRQLQTRRCII